ncbi:hypothetical protein TCAL_06813 [Tigriopus californicus]|uniref:DEUBAD domain-containing protein n=1 Tax=Tigriopus californicus TaxID=6832 RepID=A0A553PLA6_TIGCA|nr:nuclear factor related to kappa-B-binding protein-like [Tigriopus californicus]TRY78471.1 hypothetical protein TCAL_06813 [Tigriopus californicus]|eukprot:TCALIF_06813-PA protein Name:"Similar to Nfrkb Nuclear factor related to kappa-B-binding protein (Mus musculus)" AED:0.00 eAED:0.00 QI:148/1/0.83/1/1/1/6/72/1234
MDPVDPPPLPMEPVAADQTPTGHPSARIDPDPEDTEEEDGFESVILGSVQLSLPAGLCRNTDILDQFFSLDLWDALDPPLQARLQHFLPVDAEVDAAETRALVGQLFQDQNFHFGNPLTRLKAGLAAGEMTPEKTRVRRLLRRIQRRNYKERTRERAYTLLQDMLTSRKKLIESRTGQPARTPMSVLKLERKSVRATPDLEFKIAQRYLKERSLIRREGAQVEEDVSEDEFYPNGPPKRKPQRREVNLLDSDYWKSFTNDKPATVPLKSSAVAKPSANASVKPSPKPRVKEDPSLKSLNATGFKTVLQSSLLHQPSPAPPPVAAGQSLLSPPSQDKPKDGNNIDDSRAVEEAVANIPGMDDLVPSDTFGTVSCEEVIETSEVPLDVEADVEPEGPACYFSVLRDCFTANAEAKITIPDLEDKISQWQASTSRLNCDWLHLASSWMGQIPSAVAFLTGAFPDAQPSGFKPFILVDPSVGTYQWTGHGMDSDVHLSALTKWWLERRDRCRAVATSSEAPTPTTEAAKDKPKPLANFSSTPEERHMFQEQERQRFSNPNQPYTYRMYGRSSVVGPLKPSSKHNIKQHPLMIHQRPPYITMVVLVRDAVARLTQGQGTRNEIVELLRDSQYLNEEGLRDANALSQCVSGALDRLQSEMDPCVKYDGAKKIWTNLHHDRSEEDFAQAHQQFLASQTKPPKRGEAAKKDLQVQNQVASLSSQIPTGILERALEAASKTTTLGQASPQVDASMSLSPGLPSPLAPPTSIPMSTLPSSSSGQTVQVMTSQGLKTFQLSTGSAPIISTSPLGASSGATKSTSILTRGPEAKMASPSQSLLLSPNRLPSKPLLPKMTLPPSVAPPAPSVGSSLLGKVGTSLLQTGPAPVQTSLLSPRPPQRGIVSQAPLGQQPQTVRQSHPLSTVRSSPQASSQIQRVIVKNSDGKQVQLTAAQLQKLIASGAIKQSVQIAVDSQGSTPKKLVSTAPALDAAVSSIVARTMNSSPRMTTVVSHSQVRSVSSPIRVSAPNQPSLVNVNRMGRPQVQQSLIRVGQGGATQPIRYLNLSQASPATTGNLMKILSTTNNQVRVIPGGQSGGIRLAQTSAGTSLLQPSQLPAQPVQFSMPSVISAPAPAPPPQASGNTTIRLNQALSAGQRVIVGGKEYVLGTNAAGQQVLTPTVQQQQLQQHQLLGQAQTVVQQHPPQVVVQQGQGVRSVLLNHVQSNAIQNIRIVQQQQQQQQHHNP